MFWKISLGFLVLIIVIFGLAFWSTDRCIGCYTIISFTYRDISDFNQTQIIKSIRENLTNDPTIQNRNFGYLESTEFQKSTIKDNIMSMEFPMRFESDSKELLVIIKTLNEIESILEVSEPSVKRLSAP